MESAGDNDHDDEEDKEDKEDREYRSMGRSVSNFEMEYGRRPRILVVKIGQDGQDLGSRVISPASPPRPDIVCQRQQ